MAAYKITYELHDSDAHTAKQNAYISKYEN